MFRKTAIIVIVLFSTAVGSVQGFGIWDNINSMDDSIDQVDESLIGIDRSLGEIETCFKNMNRSMQRTMMMSMHHLSSTSMVLRVEINTMNRHLSDLKTDVHNFSRASSSVEESMEELDDMKDLAMMAMVGAVFIALVFLVVFVVSVRTILKKLDK